MKRILIGAVLFSIALAGAAIAQNPPSPPPEPGVSAAPPPERPVLKRRAEGGMGNRAPDADTRQLLEQVMIARMSQELALDDEQTVLLVRRFTEYREQIRERQRKRGEMARALRDELRGNRDSAGIQANLDALIAYDKETDTLKRGMFDTGSAELTPWQRARLYLFVGEFDGEMRNLLNKAREKTRRGPDSGADPARLRQHRPGPESPPAEKRPSPPESAKPAPEKSAAPAAPSAPGDAEKAEPPAEQ